ncbi:MAG: hypothetical protein ACKVQR_01755 [Aquabacterium sp.]
MADNDNHWELQLLRRTRCAVAFADLVESVPLMRDPQADAIDRWRHFTAQARALAVPAHGGRLVRTDGDALLMEFPGTPQAVAAAAALHQGIGLVNHGRPPSQWMRLRIGIHLDEVLFDDVEAYGPGVNLAKRVTGLAQPGETLLTAAARDALADGLHADLQDMGERWVKHIDEPVRVFRASSTAADGTVRSLPARADAATDLRPMLAVVPFRCVPANPIHDALGVAMADDIIAAVSRSASLRVLSRLTTSPLRDLPLDIAQVRSVTGASYLLHGTAVVRGTHVHLRAELSEVASGEVAWAGGAQADIDALFAGQDDLVPAIVAQVSQHVHAFELARTRRLPMESLASFSLYLGATGLMDSLSTSDFQRSREALEHLAERHPRQAAPHAMLGLWHIMRIAQGWSPQRDHDGARARDAVRRALDIDADLPDAHVAAAKAAEMFDDDAALALHHAQHALDQDASNPHAWSLLSSAHVTAGAFEKGLLAARQAIDLSPLDPQRYLYETYAARAAFACHEHAEAAHHARESVRRNLHHAVSHRMLIGALWEDGQHEAARLAAQTYLRLFPGASAAGTVDPPGARRRTGRFVQALRAAGVPE